MKRMVATGFGVLAVLAVACGGSGVAPGTRSAGDVTASGMSQSFAGKNKCNPKNANRPFIIEWDATDMSSFESRAANDVIFVKYEGCELTVIDSCVNDSVKGSFGSYKPVEWTSGSLESLDINDEGDLYAKLPLGAASLGGRVEGGEKFHMEYFVSGTRSSTRDVIYRADLKKVPSCKDATHFVYGYNLGAFALGAQSNLKGSVGGSAFGFGAGGDRSHSSKADKQGGVLASCRGESAKEMDTCKVPIRLTLREIAEGESADAQEAVAPETPEALNLAGKLQAGSERAQQASALLQSAMSKFQARDGTGCLADLDKHDKLDPKNLSTNVYANTRAYCVMLTGQCAPGKNMMRKYYQKTLAGQIDAGQIDGAVERDAGRYCQGGAMTPRDQFIKAGTDLRRSVTDTASCMKANQTIKRLKSVVTPNDIYDNDVKYPQEHLTHMTVGCLAHAGDCDAAWKLWQAEPDPSAFPRQSDVAMRAGFRGATLAKCPR